MAKFHHPSKLSKQEQAEIIYELAAALAGINNTNEALALIKDLLSVQEAEMLAKRVKIAELLLEGYDYNSITFSTKASSNTIARVNEWLKHSGDGYRILIERLKKNKPILKNSSKDTSWSELKHRYPITFWPQLLMDELVRGANKKQKEKLRRVIEEMDKKSEIYKQIDKTLREKGEV